MNPGSPVSRRSVLKGLGAAGAAAVLAELTGCSSSARSSAPRTTSTTARVAAPPGPIRKPGSRPNPTLPEGVDTLPQIEHIVVVMMENHSYDDHLGMLGRGDGFRLDGRGQPVDANPDGQGNLVQRVPHAVDLPARADTGPELGGVSTPRGTAGATTAS